MAELRTALAAVLGIGLGAVILAFPEFAIRVHTVGRRPHDRHGDVGGEDHSDRLHMLVRVIGALAIIAGLYFGYTVVQ